jgi:hypothetical protein
MQFFSPAILAATLMVAVPAAAEKLPLPKASFSADVTFEAKGRSYGGHINADGPKERREIKGSGGVASVKIIRRDQGKVYDLRPQRHLAVALHMAAAMAAGETGAPGTDIDSFYGAEVEPSGKETISGLETTKYDVSIEPEPGLTVKSTVWMTEDGIVVRMIGKTSLDSDNFPAKMELKNIVRGPQDAALFELPQGMSVLSPDSEGDSPEAAPNAAQQPPAK